MVWWKKQKAGESHEGDQVAESTPGTEADAADVADDVAAETQDSAPIEISAETNDSTEAEVPTETAVPAETNDSAETTVPAETEVPAQADDEGTPEVVPDETAEAEQSVDTEDSTVEQTTDETADDIQETQVVEETLAAPTPDFEAPFSATVVSNTMVNPGVTLKPAAKKTGHKLRNTLLTVAGSILGAVMLVTGCGAIGTSYFDNHAKPGTELAGRDLTGFSMTQVRNVAATLIENYTAKLELQGQQAEATAKDLGITFDLEKTVGGAMNAGNTAAMSDRYNPFNTKKTLLVMSINEEKLQSYLNDAFISDAQRSTPAEVVYDADQGGFTVQPGKDGTEADAAAVAKELKAGKGINEVLTVATISESPRITTESAQQTADAANQLLATPYTVTAASKSYTIPTSSIASWVQFTPDEDRGVITMSINADQATADIPAILSENLSAPVQAQQNLYSPDGRYLGVQRSGTAGTEVADPAGVTAQIVQALVDKSGMDATVDTKATPFPEEQVSIQDGVKWVEINRSAFTVTRWEGGTQLSTWSVVIGKPSTPTYTGIYHVWAKVRIQDMRGADYNTPDVPWVAYFNGDIALHGNYWVGSFGWASSHGCVGMPVGQAEIMYNWIDVGTLVVVHD